MTMPDESPGPDHACDQAFPRFQFLKIPDRVLISFLIDGDVRLLEFVNIKEVERHLIY